MQELTLKIAGLYTSPNELSSVPDGALIKADNIDIIKDNIAEPRRGYRRLAAGFTDSADRVDVNFFYQDIQFAHHGTLYSADTLSYFESGVWNLIGAYSAPNSNIKIKTLQSNQNLYFTSSEGVKKLDSYSGTVVQSGVSKGLDIQAAVTGATGFLANGDTVAYRVLFGYRDANDNLIIGAPSGRVEVTNSSGGTRNVSVTFTLPSDVTESYFYQISRSAGVSTGSPNDELQLVFEANPTAGEITAGTVTVTDEVPDELRGAVIYTAATQQGIAFQNERPPLCEDIALFRNVVFYANTTSKHRYSLTLISVGGTNGIAVNDTITIGGITYTGKATETVASAYFAVVTGGSASQNIADTAESLVKVINRHTSSTVNAYYLSGPDDLPGQMLIEERSIGGAAFSVTSSVDTCWNPTDIPTSGTTSQSSNDRFKNGISWAKPLVPEAVPLVNNAKVGSEDDEILRIIPLREALLIFKQDGIYRLTGSYPAFDIELLDSSAKLQGRETPDILNNQIYCLTDQGVSVVSDGVQIISRPIEEDLRRLFADDLSLVDQTSFGVGYETERKYHLFLVNNSSSTAPDYSFVFNVFTNCWTKHIYSATSGVVYKNNLYLGDKGSNFIVKDEKAFNYLDYADFGFATTISIVSGTSITIGSSIDLIAPGDVIYQSDTVFARVVSVDNITAIATVDSEPGFSVAACDIYKAISTEIEFVPFDMGNAGILKQHHTVIFLFKFDYNGTGYMITKSDISPDEVLTPIAGLGSSLWGLFNWGQARWGGRNLKRPVRMLVPRKKQVCSQLSVGFKHAWGYSPWELQGITVHAESTGSEKVGR